MKKISAAAIIYDLDFTLFDPRSLFPDVVLRAWKEASRAMGLADERPPKPETILNSYGEPAEFFFASYLPDTLKQRWREVQPHHNRAELELLTEGRGKLMPGAADILRALHDRGKKQAIASNCGQAYLDAVQDALAIRPYIHAAVCLGGLGVKTKSQLVAHILTTLKPSSAVMVGDRRHDVEAAHHNGIGCIGVASGPWGRSELREADALAENLYDLPNILA